MTSQPPPSPPRDESDPVWARATLRIARAAVVALPAYAVAYLWLSLLPGTAPAADPAAWVATVTADGYAERQLLIGAGTALLGLVALVAVAALLAGARGRGFAAAGLLAGLVAVVLWLPQYGLSAFAAPAMGEAVPGGAPAAARTYEQMYAQAGELAVAGTLLFGVAWFLLGIAVWRSRVLNRADGVLLIMAAPLLGVGGFYLDMLVSLGALLLLAAGIGIAWTGGRAAQSAVWPSTSKTPTTSGSPTTAA